MAEVAAAWLVQRTYGWCDQEEHGCVLLQGAPVLEDRDDDDDDVTEDRLVLIGLTEPAEPRVRVPVGQQELNLTRAETISLARHLAGLVDDSDAWPRVAPYAVVFSYDYAMDNEQTTPEWSCGFLFATAEEADAAVAALRAECRTLFILSSALRFNVGRNHLPELRFFTADFPTFPTGTPIRDVVDSFRAQFFNYGDGCSDSAYDVDIARLHQLGLNTSEDELDLVGDEFRFRHPELIPFMLVLYAAPREGLAGSILIPDVVLYAHDYDSDDSAETRAECVASAFTSMRGTTTAAASIVNLTAAPGWFDRDGNPLTESPFLDED